MNSFEVNNQHMNYLNNIGTKNIVAIKRNPMRYIAQNNFGERVQEKKNYLLYVSGNQKSYYELNPQETQFKSKEKNNKKLYNNKSFITYRNKIKNNYIIPEHFNQDNILDVSENYGYKETRNIKDKENNNIKTLYDNQKTQTQRETMHKINKIKNTENKIYQRALNQNSERNYKIKVIKANKSTDNILRRKTNYKITINNETMPNNHNSKVIKVTKDKNGKLKEIYLRKYVPKNEAINNIEHLYINNYGEKSHEPNYYFKNNNFNCNFYNIYNYENKSTSNNNNIKKNKYFINNNYESNGYDFNNNYGFFRQEICGDDESKNIECPIHKNISIVVHKNRHINNQMYMHYK